MSWSSKTVPKYYHMYLGESKNHSCLKQCNLKQQKQNALSILAHELSSHAAWYALILKCQISHRGIYWLLRCKGLGTLINGGYISCRSNDFHFATPLTMTAKCIKHQSFINLLRSFAWAFAKRSAVLCNSLGTEQCPKTGSLSTCHWYRKGRIKKNIKVFQKLTDLSTRIARHSVVKILEHDWTRSTKSPELQDSKHESLREHELKQLK